MEIIKVYKTQLKKNPKDGAEKVPLQNVMLNRKRERKSEIDTMDLNIIKKYSMNENDTEQHRQEMYSILVKYTNKRDMKLMDDILHCDCGDLSIHTKAVLDAYIDREDFIFRNLNIIPMYFADRLVENKCVITKNDIEDIIDRAKKIQADNTLAETLLPTKENEYNEQYFHVLNGVADGLGEIISEWDEKTAAWIEIIKVEKTRPIRKLNIDKTTQE